MMSGGAAIRVPWSWSGGNMVRVPWSWSGGAAIRVPWSWAGGGRSGGRLRLRGRSALELRAHPLREDLEHLVAHVLDHAAAHLRQDPADVHVRAGGDLRLPGPLGQYRARETQIRTAAPAHVLAGSDDLRGMRGGIELLERDLALVAGGDGPDLDGHRALPGVIVELSGDGRSRQAARYALGVGQQAPDVLGTGVDHERLHDVESHGEASGGEETDGVGEELLAAARVAEEVFVAGVGGLVARGGHHHGHAADRVDLGGLGLDRRGPGALGGTADLDDLGEDAERDFLRDARAQIEPGGAVHLVDGRGGDAACEQGLADFGE